MNKIDELNRKMDEMATKLGPEYVALMARLAGHRSEFERSSGYWFDARGARQAVCEVATSDLAAEATDPRDQIQVSRHLTLLGQPASNLPN